MLFLYPIVINQQLQLTFSPPPPYVGVVLPPQDLTQRERSIVSLFSSHEMDVPIIYTSASKVPTLHGITAFHHTDFDGDCAKNVSMLIMFYPSPFSSQNVCQAKHQEEQHHHKSDF